MKKFVCDLKRYKALNHKSLVYNFLFKRQVWSIFEYRVANGIYNSRIPKFLKIILLAGCSVWKLTIELINGISIRYTAQIGKGFYIGHPGMIRIAGKTIIGDYCNISHGVTIGISGRNEKRGIPVIGNNVWIGANAVIGGKIFIGDRSVIGANSLVIKNVEEDCTVIGVPAKKISNKNSDYYIVVQE